MPTKKKLPRNSVIPVLQIDIDALQEKCIEVIRRDIQHKMEKVVDDTLDARDAKAIVDYTRLLTELKGIQEDHASNLTDEQLEEILKHESGDVSPSEGD